MEQLKLAIADKILEASSGDQSLMQQKLRKIQRLSDFAEAVKSLAAKYPEIEDELLRMVKDDDFDTSKASRRVDSILQREQNPLKSGDFLLLETAIESEPPAAAEEAPVSSVSEITEAEIAEQEPEKTDKTEPETPLLTDEAAAEDTLVLDEPPAQEEIVYSTFTEENTANEESSKKRRTVILVIKAALVAALLIGVYFVVRNYWQIILAVVGIGLAGFIGWKIYRRKQTRKE